MSCESRSSIVASSLPQAKNNLLITLLRRAALAAACLIFLSCAATREQWRSSPEYRRESSILVGCSLVDSISSVVGLNNGLREANPVMKPLAKYPPVFFSAKTAVAIYQINQIAKEKKRSEEHPEKRLIPSWKTSSRIVSGMYCGIGVSNSYLLWSSRRDAKSSQSKSQSIFPRPVILGVDVFSPPAAKPR